MTSQAKAGKLLVVGVVALFGLLFINGGSVSADSYAHYTGNHNSSVQHNNNKNGKSDDANANDQTGKNQDESNNNHRSDEQTPTVVANDMDNSDKKVVLTPVSEGSTTPTNGDDKQPCDKSNHQKPTEHQPSQNDDRKAPCPENNKPVEHKPCPEEHKQPCPTEHKKPCPTKPVEHTPCPKPPVVSPPCDNPPVVTPPVVTPPVVTPPVVTPPVVTPPVGGMGGEAPTPIAPVAAPQVLAASTTTPSAKLTDTGLNTWVASAIAAVTMTSALVVSRRKAIKA